MEHAKPVCNLNVANQTARLRSGVIAVGVALAIAVTMLKLGVSTPARLLLVIPFMGAALGLLQGLHGT